MKRLFAWLLTMAMLLSVAPQLSLAVSAETDCSHVSGNYTAWTETASLPSEGSYYLTEDVTLSAEVAVTGTLNLCLNGKTVKSDGTTHRAFNVTGTLNLYDCATSYDAEGSWIGGKITGFTNAGGQGGAVYVAENAVVSLQGCAFTDNSAQDGGVIYTMATSNTQNLFSVTITDCFFSGNSATADSGVMEIQCDSGKGATVNILNSRFENNSAAVTGGVFTFADSTVSTVTGCSFKNNSAKTGGVGQSENSGLKVTFDGCSFTENKATGGNGGCFYLNWFSTVTIYGCTFEGNTSTGSGGVIDARGNTSARMFIGVEGKAANTFTENSAKTGGAISLRYQATVTVANTNFSENSATSTGGVVYVDGYGVNKLMDCTFTSNSATTSGGAVHFKGTTTNLIQDCRFTSNSSTSTSGAVHAEAFTKLEVYGCTFTKNSTKTNSGALDIVGSAATNTAIVGGAGDLANTFLENTAQNGAAIGLRGAATTTVTNTTFIKNAATDCGGAIWFRQTNTTTVTDCTFTQNSANVGGAISSNTNVAITPTATFENCDFTSNTATGNGGAVQFTKFAKLAFYGCAFKENTSGSNGGAMRIEGTAATNTVTIGDSTRANTFTGNKATNTGASAQAGAISFSGSATTVMTNATFTENTADKVASVSVAGTHKLTMQDCTLQNNKNTAGYGSLYMANGSQSLVLRGMVIVDELFFQQTSANNAKVDVSGLTEGSDIAVNMQSVRCQDTPVFTLNSSAAAKSYVYSATKNYFVHEVDGELALVKHVDEEGNYYTTTAAAIAAAEEAGKTSFALQTSTVETLTLNTISYLDLQGWDVTAITVADGNELTLIDSATDDYDCYNDNGYGLVSNITGSYKLYVEDITSGSLKRYVAIDEGNGISVHRVYLAITHKTLRPGNSGVGFKAIFAGDQVVTKSGVTYGLELSGYSDFSESWKAVFGTMESGKANGTPNQKTVVLTDAITADNTSRWDADLYGRPFITVGDTTVYGAEATVNMKAMAANAVKSDDATIVAAVQAMMTACGVSVN